MMGAVFAQGAQWIRVDSYLRSTDQQPNNLSIGNIKAGNSNMHNPILASFAAKLLPYRGLRNSLLRALWAWLQIELVDDWAGNLFKVVVAQPQEQAA